MFRLTRKAAKQRTSSFRPQFEQLESREVMSVTLHGGPVIAHVQAQSVYYGQDWTTPANQANANQLDTYLGFITGSSYMSQLGEYGVATGSFGRRDLVTGTTSPVSGNMVTETGLQSMLATEIRQGRLPESTGSQVDVIYLPPNVQSQQDVNLGNAAHHQSFTMTFQHGTYTTTDTVYYIVVPNPVGNTENSLLNALTNYQKQTVLTSHELAETVTDPQVWRDSAGNFYGTGWNDGTSGNHLGNNEIGDINNCDYGFLGAYAVQKEYSNWFNAGVLTLSDANKAISYTSYGQKDTVGYGYYTELLSQNGHYYCSWQNLYTLDCSGWFEITSAQYNSVVGRYSTNSNYGNPAGTGGGGGGGGVMPHTNHPYPHRMM